MPKLRERGFSNFEVVRSEWSVSISSCFCKANELVKDIFSKYQFKVLQGPHADDKGRIELKIHLVDKRRTAQPSRVLMDATPSLPEHIGGTPVVRAEPRTRDRGRYPPLDTLRPEVCGLAELSPPPQPVSG